MKKHEQEGPHVSDSPTPELDDKDDAYFSEIRNFIGNSGKDEDEEEREKTLVKERVSVSDEADINVENDLSIGENVEDANEELDGDDEDELVDDVDISDEDILDESATAVGTVLGAEKTPQENDEAASVQNPGSEDL